MPSLAAGRKVTRSTYHAPQAVVVRHSCYEPSGGFNGLGTQIDGTGFQI
jgi:hypothetical protein